MRARPLWRLALFCGALLPSALSAQSSGVGPSLGTPAPAATLEDLDGNAVDLLQYTRGKPALIEFWATWCENCEALQPQLDRIHDAYGDRVAVVAVAVGVSQSLRRVRRHVEQHEPGYPYLWDGKGTAVRAYDATTTSVVVILDAQGKVVYTGVGADQDLLGAMAAVAGSD
ncbi:MAG: TlpA disulfide reductase family protein [Gemmatimonadota bacterium]